MNNTSMTDYVSALVDFYHDHSKPSTTFVFKHDSIDLLGVSSNDYESSYVMRGSFSGENTLCFFENNDIYDDNSRTFMITFHPDKLKITTENGKGKFSNNEFYDVTNSEDYFNLTLIIPLPWSYDECIEIGKIFSRSTNKLEILFLESDLQIWREHVLNI